MTDALRPPMDLGRRRSAKDQAAGPVSRHAARQRAPLFSGRFFVFALVFLAALTLFDFVRFSDGVARLAPPTGIRAEGIVALTGGAARIDGALALLADGRGERLLISGVNPAVGRREIARRTAGDQTRIFEGDVDLGHAARDTIGNAGEARDWAMKNGFRSLIIVTSDYHMPRSMIELAGAMPDIALIPYPVSNPQLDMARWWRHTASLKLLMAEYVKYTLARARLAVESPWGTTPAATPVRSAAAKAEADAR